MASILDRYGIKEVADVTFYKLNENGIPTYPVLYLDTLKVSTIEQTAETTEARGGKGNAPLISWDYGKEITVTLEDALFSAKSLAIMFGNGTVKSYTGDNALIMKTEVFTATATTLPVEGADASGWKHQYEGPNGKLYEKVNPKFYDAAGNIVTTLVKDDKYFCTFDIKVNGKVVDVGSNTFPGTYYITGDTYARSDASGDDQFFQFIIPKAKVQSENTITLEAEGDPSVFNMNLQVLRPADGIMMKLVQYDGADGVDPAAEGSTATIIHNHDLVPASTEVTVGAGSNKQIDVVGAASAESSNTNYVTVGAIANNKVTINGVAAGTAQITVSDADGNVIADLNVTVTA